MTNKLKPMYKLNAQTLTYQKVNMLKRHVKYGMAAGAFAMVCSLGTHLWTKTHVVESLTDYEKVLLVEEVNAFSEDKLIAKLKELNFKYPHIVLAQAKLESGNFRSHVFETNHNLFGMKEATSRLNLAKGTDNGHATYATWEDSVMDYALWCTAYASKAHTEEQYYQILSEVGYAENPAYIQKLKEMVQNDNLKSLF